MRADSFCRRAASVSRRAGTRGTTDTTHYVWCARRSGRALGLSTPRLRSVDGKPRLCSRAFSFKRRGGFQDCVSACGNHARRTYVDVIDVHAHVCVCLVRTCVVRTSAPVGPNLVPVVCMCMRVGGAWGLPVSSCGAPRKIYVQRPAPFRTCCLVVWVAMFGAAYEATAPLGHPMNRHDFHCVGRFAMTHGFVGLSPGCSGRSPWQGRRTPYEARIPTESMFAVWPEDRERERERE